MGDLCTYFIPSVRYICLKLFLGPIGLELLGQGGVYLLSKVFTVYKGSFPVPLMNRSCVASGGGTVDRTIKERTIKVAGERQMLWQLPEVT